MPMLPVMLLLAAIYALLTYVALPRIEKKWRASSNYASVGRAGTVAAITTAQSFVKLALIVFVAAFVVLGLLSLIAPLAGASALTAVHMRLGGLVEAVRDGKALMGNALLVLALAGLAFLSWRIHRRGLRAILEEERNRQLTELYAKRDAGELEAQDPTAEMEVVLKRYAELDFIANNNPTVEGLTPDQVQEAIAAQMHALAFKFQEMDIERRIDLTAMPLTEARPDGWWARLRLMLFSRGTSEGLGWMSKNLGRAATVLTCLLMIGVSAPALARYGIQPTLARLADLQVSRNEKAALDSLRQIARQADEQANASPATPAEQQAYHAAAQHFVNAVARSQAWTQATARLLPDRAELVPVSHATDIVEEASVRQKILEVYSDQLRARFPADSVHPIVSDLGGVTDAERRRYVDRLGDSRPAAARREYAQAVDRTEKWVAAQAKASPSFKSWLMDGVAKFHQPATAWDVTSKLLGEGLSRSIAEALPEPTGSDPFARQARGTVRSGLSSAGQRLVQQSFNDFLKAHAGKTSYGAAIGRVEQGLAANWPFRHDEAVLIRNMADRIQADRQKIRLAMNDSAPGLTVKASAGERKAAQDAVVAIRQHAAASELPGIVSRVEGTLGDFEYHFPAAARSATQAANTAGLAELAQVAGMAGDAASGGGGGGSPAGNVRGSRNFRMMRASFRAGGVVIGADPALSERLDFQRFEWRPERGRLRLTMVDGAGRRIELGDFGGAMIQQALAYAADGRQMTVTMTESPLTPGMLRVHLHPALLDTRFGCRIIELDRFTDEAAATGKTPQRVRWEPAVKDQLTLYAIAAEGKLAEAAEQSGQGTIAAMASKAFTVLDDVNDPRKSVFAASPTRFDPGLARRLKQCSARPGSFADCVGDYSVNSVSYRMPSGWEVWSGVRERDFELRRSSFAGLANPAASPPPLRFMLQVAFRQDESDCVGGPCEAEQTESSDSWEFPVIAEEIDRQVLGHVKTQAANAAIFAEAAEFTVLQRLFRAALRGQLGTRFERAGLVAMMRDAATTEPIGFLPTAQWHVPRSVAEANAAKLRDMPEASLARFYRTTAEARASRAYIDALLAPGSGARFADANCR